MQKSQLNIHLPIPLIQSRASLGFGHLAQSNFPAYIQGSITATIEADDVEIHGNLDGKVTAQNIVIGATGTVKGDIEFGNNLKTLPTSIRFLSAALDRR